MSITSNTTETISSLDSQTEFDWKNCWYPIIFIRDFSNKFPYAFTLYNEPLVLFEAKNGQLACLKDICPHRAAKLSDGQLIEGKIECLYHGWQFDLAGKCQHIPQLPKEAAIPRQACVESFVVVKKQEIVWLWRGEKELANEDLIPTIANLDSASFVVTDFAIDLPYAQSYLIENLLDPAHVHISHDGSLGNRQDAQPLRMEILESSLKGIQGRYKYSQKANSSWINLNWAAPNLVTYSFSFGPKIKAVMAFYSLPTAKGNCRLLLRNYSNFLTWKTKLEPRWLSHFKTNRILEEDCVFIVAEQSYLEQSGQSMQSIFLPLKTSDVLVVEYRKWLDQYGQSLPFYQGYTTSKLVRVKSDNESQQITPDRFKQHTQICRTCTKAYQTTIRTKQILIGIAITLAALAIITDSRQIKILLVTLSILSVILGGIANFLKSKFELSYHRHSQKT